MEEHLYAILVMLLAPVDGSFFICSGYADRQCRNDNFFTEFGSKCYRTDKSHQRMSWVMYLPMAMVSYEPATLRLHSKNPTTIQYVYFAAAPTCLLNQRHMTAIQRNVWLGNSWNGIINRSNYSSCSSSLDIQCKRYAWIVRGVAAIKTGSTGAKLERHFKNTQLECSFSIVVDRRANRSKMYLFSYKSRHNTFTAF